MVKNSSTRGFGCQIQPLHKANFTLLNIWRFSKHKNSIDLMHDIFAHSFSREKYLPDQKAMHANGLLGEMFTLKMVKFFLPDLPQIFLVLAEISNA